MRKPYCSTRVTRVVPCVLTLLLTASCSTASGDIAPKASATTIGAASSDPAALPPYERLYAADSTFNQAIPPNPEIDPNSDRMVARLSRIDQTKNFPLAVREWTVPIYEATAETPVQDVNIVNGYDNWVMRMPIPTGAAPDPQGDAHMTVINRAAGCEYDLWRAAKTDQGWRAELGNATSIRGSGIYPRGMSTRGSGFASAAGMVWPQELAANRIDHALLFSYPSVKSGGPVAPATESDGTTTAADAIPEGARLQLDPSLDLDSFGLAPYERTIARALQQYGMLLGDVGGTVTMFAVGAQSLPPDAYDGLLPDGPYAYLDQALLPHMRVLKLGPQQPNPPLEIVPVPGCEIRK